MEAAYRFLVQPDPYLRIVKKDGLTQYEGVDRALLAERKAFLRSDSAVAVVLITDENESSVAPTALAGRSWLFTSSMHVRPGTSACAHRPESAECQSCYVTSAAGDPNCSGMMDDSTDAVPVRFADMKRRFGIDPRYPLARYASGFTQRTAPTRNEEYQGEEYVGEAQRSCTNPLFAAQLPGGATDDELCALPRGPRGSDNVYVAVLGGLPWQLLTDAPDDLSATNAAPYKAELDAADWQRLVGADPLAYRFDGQHPLMRESMAPRAGASADGSHTREWDTRGQDLQ